MKKKSQNKRWQNYLTIFLIVVITVIYLDYNKNSNEAREIVVPTIGNEGFSLFNAEPIKLTPDEETALKNEGKKVKGGHNIAIQPGKEFPIKLGIKNHSKIEIRNFEIRPESFVLADENNKEKIPEDQLPTIKLKKNRYTLKPSSFEIVEAKIQVPESTPLNDYQALIASIDLEQAEHKKNLGGVEWGVASGVTIKLSVNQNQTGHNYRTVDIEKEIQRLALANSLITFRYIIAISFATLAVYFGIAAFQKAK